MAYRDRHYRSSDSRSAARVLGPVDWPIIFPPRVGLGHEGATARCRQGATGSIEWFPSNRSGRVLLFTVIDGIQTTDPKPSFGIIGLPAGRLNADIEGVPFLLSLRYKRLDHFSQFLQIDVPEFFAQPLVFFSRLFADHALTLARAW